MPTKWEVVGGADRGGILVRKGPEPTAPASSERLATGSTVEQVEVSGVRLHYKLLTGNGPPKGWVAIRLPDKELLVPWKDDTSGLWDFDDLPQGEAGQQPPADPPLGSCWNPRNAKRPSPEAPYARSLLDFSVEEALEKIPKCIFSLKQFMKLKDFKENVDKVKPGSHWGIPFPHDFDLLREAGAKWLTKAFHRAGTLPFDNSVVQLEVHELSTDAMAAESMGGQGMKGWLEVAYKKPHPELHTNLFVKLPFPYTPQNERLKNSFNFMVDESEILINRVLGTALPFPIPKYYFGDISYETSNYILISEMIHYKKSSWAEGGKNMIIKPYEVEPRIVKFKDYEMPRDGFEQYESAMRAQGRMFAEYHKGGLGDKELLRILMPKQKESLLEAIGWEAFMESAQKEGGLAVAMAPFYGSIEAVLADIQRNSHQALQMAEAFGSQMVEFVRTIAPGIYPELTNAKAYLARWYREAMEVAYYSWEIKVYVSVDPAFTSLLHCNLAADNAWYWRDDQGVLQAGLLDFGGSSHSNIAVCLLSSWVMAEPDMLREHWQDLLSALVDGVRESAGPESVTYEEMLICAALAFASSSPMTGGNVPQLMKAMKRDEWGRIRDRWDPVVNDRFLNRNYTCAVRTTLLIWEYMDLYRRFTEWRDKNQWWFIKKKPFVCPSLPPCLT